MNKIGGRCSKAGNKRYRCDQKVMVLLAKTRKLAVLQDGNTCGVQG